MIAQFKAARAVGVPLVAITTPDQQATVAELTELANGSKPFVRWDAVRGAVGLNEPGQIAVTAQFGDDARYTTANLTECLDGASRFPEKTILVLLNAQRFLSVDSVVQAICNLRDEYSTAGSTLVLLGPAFDLPVELAGDVLQLDEPLPTTEQIADLLRDVAEDAQVAVTAEAALAGAEALTGLSKFAAEQATALSLVSGELEQDGLWERKRQMISAQKGLTVWKGQEGFDSLRGLENLKGFERRLLRGPGAPRVVVFIDEIDKSVAGGAGTGDTSGVSQDYHGTLLSWMQDTGATGILLFGPAGTGKSEIAKATGNEAGIPTVVCDLGAMKGSLVGESEQALRNALKTIRAVGQGNALVIATCNRIQGLTPELRRRFRLGTFFVDLPTAAEREAIWSLYLDKFGLADEPAFSHDGWTGAEIRQCCENAWRLGCDLQEAAQFIVPVSISAANEIASLRQQADGRFISASYPGKYRLDGQPKADTPKRRQFVIGKDE